MFIETVPNRSSPPAVLLRESYRDEQGRAHKRTLANLTKLPSECDCCAQGVSEGRDGDRHRTGRSGDRALATAWPCCGGAWHDPQDRAGSVDIEHGEGCGG